MRSSDTPKGENVELVISSDPSKRITLQLRIVTGMGMMFQSFKRSEIICQLTALAKRFDARRLGRKFQSGAVIDRSKCIFGYCLHISTS